LRLQRARIISRQVNRGRKGIFIAYPHFLRQIPPYARFGVTPTVLLTADVPPDPEGSILDRPMGYATA
jgi:hypothetical protein